MKDIDGNYKVGIAPKKDNSHSMPEPDGLMQLDRL